MSLLKMTERFQRKKTVPGHPDTSGSPWPKRSVYTFGLLEILTLGRGARTGTGTEPNGGQTCELRAARVKRSSFKSLPRIVCVFSKSTITCNVRATTKMGVTLIAGAVVLLRDLFEANSRLCLARTRLGDHRNGASRRSGRHGSGVAMAAGCIAPVRVTAAGDQQQARRGLGGSAGSDHEFDQRHLEGATSSFVAVRCRFCPELRAVVHPSAAAKSDRRSQGATTPRIFRISRHFLRSGVPNNIGCSPEVKHFGFPRKFLAGYATAQGGRGGFSFYNAASRAVARFLLFALLRHNRC